MPKRGNRYWKRGEPMVWMSGAALAVALLVTLVLVGVVIRNGAGVFWPHRLVELQIRDGAPILGVLTDRETRPDGEGERVQIRRGNRDLYGLDFEWVDAGRIVGRTWPKDAAVLERAEYGNFHGYLDAVTIPGGPASGDLWAQLHQAQRTLAPLREKSKALDARLTAVSRQSERVRLSKLRLAYRGVEPGDARLLRLQSEEEKLKAAFATLMAEQQGLVAELRAPTVTARSADGRTMTIPVADLVRAYRPNAMGLAGQLRFYVVKMGELLWQDPRESNTEGGLYPAIVGTVMLVFLMSLLSFPLGVLAGVYLREYAHDGWLVRVVRIAVNNLAGIPSIVYGVFGLGFFIYGMGGSLDRIFFPERLPTPTFGTGGILWASLTLGLLTVPVVIVATEEAFSAIPRGVREASLALGATRLQTLVRVLFPMASPGIMTGLILAMARAAGEVAPLMITGVVKLAPALPLDGQAPFLHLDRKFMHLGFHIYDIGFQSPNVEAAKPMVFVTTLLLVLVVLAMTSSAIALRNRMKKKYTMGAF